ncbi:IS3 family transposase [Synechococcus sp. CBW1002]|uniref:IS3 family transposase n=1 Tax=Synechococcus sp. CBW1002 TaxID=1353134 RepID=UPI00351C092E
MPCAWQPDSAEPLRSGQPVWRAPQPDCRRIYGSPRIHQEARAAGHPVGRHRVAQLMQRAELRFLCQSGPFV